MSDAVPVPDWIKPGSNVLVKSYPIGSSRTTYTKAVVDRMTKRDIILDDASRFRRAGLSRQVGGTWGSTYYLVNPDDPDVIRDFAKYKAHNIRRNTRSRVEAYLRAWEQNDDDESGREGLSLLAQSFFRIEDLTAELDNPS